MVELDTSNSGNDQIISDLVDQYTKNNQLDNPFLDFFKLLDSVF